MFKKLIFLFITSTLIISTTNAQLEKDLKKTGGFARVSGLGANQFVADPYFITVNPAWGAVYDDYVFLDIGSNNGAFAAGGFGQFFAGSFRLNKNLTIGGMLTRNDFNGLGISLVDPGTNINNVIGVPFTGVVSTVNNAGGTVTPLDNNIELFATFSVNNTSFGFGVAYAKSTREIIPPATPANLPNTEGSASQIGFNAGILHKISRKFLIDAGVSFILPSASYQAPVANASPIEASQTVILANVRAFYALSKKVSVVPLVTFMNISGSFDSGGTNSTSSDLNSVMLIGFGIGFNYKVGDFLLAGGPSLSSVSLTTPAVENVSPELTNSAFLFPLWNIGLEWNMTNWLVARLGYVAITGSTTLEASTPTGTDPNAITESVFSFYGPSQRGVTVGLGFRFGDFSLDALINEDVLRQGLNNFGGGGATARTFAYLSAGYALP
ncbi:MAG: hypothetical protein HND52_07090 [Ignavibacteriae bacterium]|jgi:hypothetical protein|nr:hypothetical protein [Ignavibacteriota bacterium]NOG97709.1 hypothetical protein [Ignavibacteriota bacterium]